MKLLAGREGWLPEMMGRTRWTGRFCVAALAVALGLLPNWQARAENENFSNKPAPALFNADCTGAGCHKGPQGLAKGQSQSGLAGFLREHYTNSRESAAALAAYILKVPAGPPEPKPTRTSTPRGGEREPRGGSWFDPAPSGPAEARPGRQQQEKEKEKERERAKPTRSAAKPPAEAKPAEPKPEAKPSESRPAEAKPAESKPAEAKPAESEEPSSSAAAPAEPEAKPEVKPEPKPADRRRRTAEPVEKPEPKPAPVPRNQRGRQPAVAATPAPAAPSPAEHTPPPAPPPPQYDIFD